MGMFSNRSQKMSKWGKNISDTPLQLVSHFLFLPHFEVICDPHYYWRETQKQGIYLINWYCDVIELAVYINLFD